MKSEVKTQGIFSSRNRRQENKSRLGIARESARETGIGVQES
ncbi:MAG: hypothetical protein ACTTH5_06930 [Wolinella sp.]